MLSPVRDQLAMTGGDSAGLWFPFRTSARLRGTALFKPIQLPHTFIDKIPWTGRGGLDGRVFYLLHEAAGSFLLRLRGCIRFQHIESLNPSWRMLQSRLSLI
jgi:hypothetical protein